MYISPNTNIRVLHNCPLDPTYDHTLYFSSVSAQTNYFQSLTKYTFPEQTYQRVQRGRMRIERKAEDLYDCNYLMFQNTSFGSKWFYAFITGVEYINNITSEITFQIDVMQTWFFDYTLDQCFVEREHSVTDNIGDNLVPEKLELGDYVSEGIRTTNLLNETSIVIAASFDENYDDAYGGFYGNVYSGLNFITFPNSIEGANQAIDFIKNAGSKTDGIVAVFLMPTSMIVKNQAAPASYTVTFAKNYSDIDGYVPKNKKLFTYPYNFLYSTNFQGNGTAFPYEYFRDSSCKFNITGDMSCNPSCILSPMNYKGASTNYDEKMVITGFPQLAYSVDSFKAWLAQNASSLGVSALGNTIGATGVEALLFAGAVSNPIGAAVAASVAIASTLAQVTQAYVRPNQADGGAGSQTMAALRLIDFGIMNKHIRAEFARIIDDYFNMFGYATHRVKVPNRSSRPHWNYVKTIGCVATGSVPGDDMREICNIYNNGITFWKNGNNVGNYSLDNRPA